MALFGSKITAEKVAGLLTQAVVDAYKSGASDEEDLAWLKRNPATAAKIVRYYAAAAWFSADVYIQTNGVTKPSPQEFMQVWRKAIFTQIALLFDDLSPKGEQLLWTMMFDDIDAYGRIMAEQMRVNAPYLPMIVGKHWFAETQQMDILKGYNSEKSGMLVLAAAVDCQTRVTATLKEHCR
ncbi:hypothetical protein [Phenylobacterium sp.]|uniref:hypothetical protein n=1 Tax=Phenylobacterium sp. TaxID=1871053 RepID=UPI0025D757E7|nr:hypothetical protein [Phenylobacterium sp.]